MATISTRSVVDAIIARNGWSAPGDPQVVKVVEYNNMFDGRVAYGLVYRGENMMRYEQSPACRNPRVIWEATR